MNAYETNLQLGREFLTWLWFLTETARGDVTLEDHGPLALMMDTELVLAEDEGGVAVDILRAEDPSSSGEATAALLGGKKAIQAKLSLTKEADEWLFTLNQRLQLRGVRLPRGDSDHPHDIFTEQMQGIEELSGVLDTLYGQFLGKRLTSSWPGELQRMRAWVEGR